MPKQSHGMTNTSIYHRWCHFRHQGVLCRAWRDFAAFYLAVGDPPAAHKLRRKDRTKRLGPGNWEWLPLENLTGRVYGSVTVIEYLGRRPVGLTGTVQSCYRCRCECGREYTLQASNLKRISKCKVCESAELTRRRWPESP